MNELGKVSIDMNNLLIENKRKHLLENDNISDAINQIILKKADKYLFVLCNNPSILSDLT